MSFKSKHKLFFQIIFLLKFFLPKVYDRKISDVNVRIYQPEESIPYEQQTTLIYFHGGGFLLGSIETYDQANYRLANLTRTTLIAVE